MTEKAYKEMGTSGIIGLVVGITMIATGIVSGTILIISSAKLFKAKNKLTFQESVQFEYEKQKQTSQIRQIVVFCVYYIFAVFSDFF